MELEDIQTSLSEMIALLECQYSIVDTCMVDFITKNIFQRLSKGLQRELLELEDDSLVLLPALLHDEQLKLPSRCPELSRVLSDLRDVKMEARGLITDLQEANMGSDESSLSNWDKMMTEKKTHEVDRMSQWISNSVSRQNLSSIVDLGSGKVHIKPLNVYFNPPVPQAYLSQVLNSLHNIPVLAIDGKASNTRGADTRTKNLQSKWSSLSLRASERADGGIPSSMKSRARDKQKNGPSESDREDDKTKPVVTSLVTLTKFVEESSDLGQLVEDHLPGQSDRLGIVGLHTCGDLAPTSIRTFLHTEKARLLCNVGCCYNHLTSLGFPLSSYLQMSKFQVECWLNAS